MRNLIYFFLVVGWRIGKFCVLDVFLLKFLDDMLLCFYLFIRIGKEERKKGRKYIFSLFFKVFYLIVFCIIFGL